MELTNKLKKEGLYILILFAVFLIIFKLLFFKENFWVITKTVFSLFWLFIIPGFALIYYWHDSLDFIERLIIGSALGFAVIGVIGYNLGLIGINMGYQLWIIPIASIIIGILILLKKRQKGKD